VDCALWDQRKRPTRRVATDLEEASGAEKGAPDLLPGERRREGYDGRRIMMGRAVLSYREEYYALMINLCVGKSVES